MLKQDASHAHGDGYSLDFEIKLKVIKRNGTLVDYDPVKIETAILKAFISVEGEQAAKSQRIRDQVLEVSQLVHQKTLERIKLLNNFRTNIEQIQDDVELILMRLGHRKVARNYVLYREKRSSSRVDEAPAIHVLKKSGDSEVINEHMVKEMIGRYISGTQISNSAEMVKEVCNGLYDGITLSDVQQLCVMSASRMMQSDPDYTYVASMVKMASIIADAAELLGCEPSEADIFEKSIGFGIQMELIDPNVVSMFDLALLKKHIKEERSSSLTFLGLQTIFDRYLLKQAKTRYETPQSLFMRVAMGLAQSEDKPNEKAIEFYDLFSSLDFMPSTPTLFNSATTHPQLSSCYISTISDSLNDIFDSYKEQALLSKYAGGIGNDWTPVRAMGAHIKGTNGESQGVIPFLKIVNDTAVAVNQGGKRKGAACVYLETWHLDIEEFMDLKKNTGDDRRRVHDINTANWIPDLFMERVDEDTDWTLFSPEDVPTLHDLYGAAFKEQYLKHEEQARNGEITNFKVVKAVVLWRKMLNQLFETGHPWITFKDPCNIRSPQQHAGVVHSSNLCTEITLNTSDEEIAVCNLGSINLANHVSDKGVIDKEKIARTVTTAVRILDNVIDPNFYPHPKAQNSNLKHRPIGLGQMGFQDVLYKLGLPYESLEAVEVADELSEIISFAAIKASAELAKQKGSYESFDGSLWSKGMLPIDSIDLLSEHRKDNHLKVNHVTKLDWNELREQVKSGMRNSNIMAIAPTATISNICGVSQSIEPMFQNLFVKSNLSGEFTFINRYLVNDLRQEGIWDEVMVEDIKANDGSVQQIRRVPDTIKKKYKTAFEIRPEWLVEAAARRQKWIDQGQSLNLYMAEPSGQKLDNLYKLAWVRGLKTTYYLRSLGASSTENSSIDTRPQEPASTISEKLCAIDDSECEACQ